jgi:hypothetical protein
MHIDIEYFIFLCELQQESELWMKSKTQVLLLLVYYFDMYRVGS